MKTYEAKWISTFAISVLQKVFMRQAPRLLKDFSSLSCLSCLSPSLYTSVCSPSVSVALRLGVRLERERSWIDHRFHRSNGIDDLKFSTLVATPPGAWRYRVSVGIGWPSVSTP